MVTLSDLLLKIILPITGLAAGAIAGQSYLHWPGAIGSAVIGFVLAVYLGSLLNRVYLRAVAHAFQRQWTSLPTSELRKQLENSMTPNFILLELGRRGEDITQDLDPILALLEADEPFRRTRGWAALLSAFPNLASLLRGYNPTHSVSECHEKVADLRHLIENPRPHSV